MAAQLAPPQAAGAKENAGANPAAPATTAPAPSKLALPHNRPKLAAAAGKAAIGAGGGDKRPAGLAAAVKRAMTVVISSDSDDDFK